MFHVKHSFLSLYNIYKENTKRIINVSRETDRERKNDKSGII